MLFQTGRSRWLGLDGELEKPIAGQLVAEMPGNSLPTDTLVQSVINGDSGAPSGDHHQSIIVSPSGSRFFVRQEDDGPNSDYYRCFYKDHSTPQLCEKVAGCCTNGCCPKDTLWLGGMWILVAFVLLIMAAGLAVALVCYQRSKNKAKKPILPRTFYAGSQYTYGSDFDETMSKYSAPY